MTKFFSILLIAMASVSCNDKPTSDKDKARIDAVCDKIMLNFKNGKIPEAIHLLRENTIAISPSDIDTLQKQIVEQIEEGVFSRYGEVVACELVLERRIKDFAAKRYYVLKFKKFFIKFTISLYNSGSGWNITGFKYDEEVMELYINTPS